MTSAPDGPGGPGGPGGPDGGAGSGPGGGSGAGPRESLESDELDERTSLAWTRTGLALLVAAVVVARLTVSRLGGISVVLAVLGLAVAAWILVSSRRRFRAAHLALLSGEHRPDARLPAVLSAFTVVVALVELGAVLR